VVSKSIDFRLILAMRYAAQVLTITFTNYRFSLRSTFKGNQLKIGWKVLFSTFLTVALSGCAAPQMRYQRSVEYVNNSTIKVEGVKRKHGEAALKKELAKTKEELMEANMVIEELTEELRKAEEELRKAEEEMRVAKAENETAKNSDASSSGAVHTGPRGGKYTISPSGKKVYKKR